MESAVRMQGQPGLQIPGKKTQDCKEMVRKLHSQSFFHKLLQ